MTVAPPTLMQIAFTGGPGGGKTRFLAELGRDPAWAGRVAALPEAILVTGSLGIFPGEKLFQRVLVSVQMALEDGLQQALFPQDRRLILCDRGSLDPLAYWLSNGWDEAEFFHYTATTLEEHYRRYKAVIHLVTTADGAADIYREWSIHHRPETPQQAVKIDRLLQQVWGGHPCYYRVDNTAKDWLAKAEGARRILKIACHAVP